MMGVFTLSNPGMISPSTLHMESALIISTTYKYIQHSSQLSLQGSHISQMRKFKGISRVIKGINSTFLRVPLENCCNFVIHK